MQKKKYWVINFKVSFIKLELQFKIETKNTQNKSKKYFIRLQLAVNFSIKYLQKN